MPVCLFLEGRGEGTRGGGVLEGRIVFSSSFLCNIPLHRESGPDKGRANRRLDMSLN